MNDDDLRAMIRDAIARHLGASGPGQAPAHLAPPDPRVLIHASHGRLPLAAAREDGMCVIEPAVRCTHCGYCQSYGH